MIHAYDEAYLVDAQYELGFMLDFAVHELGFSLAEFYPLFLASPIEAKMSVGDSSIVGSRSGAELAYLVLEGAGFEIPSRHPTWRPYRSEEFWCGWALAAYQWECGLSYERIDSFAPIEHIRSMYFPYHEMDISHFLERMGELRADFGGTSELRRRRVQAGLTRERLSLTSGVPLRTIEQYEQGRKDLNKAQAATILALARTLHCSMEDLMEA